MKAPRSSWAGPLVPLVLAALMSCRHPEPEAAPVRAPLPPERSLQVTATAYNSVRAQTDAHPRNAAWRDTLIAGVRSIAVSRDLLALGLKPGMVVSIDSLAGRYIVLDKMDARWTKRIDIFFDHDVKGAKRWGERRVVIRWRDTADARVLAARPPGG